MGKEVTPVLVATHEYEWTIRAFAALFAKYWGDERVIYFGDRQESELPDNVEFRQVPAYTEGSWPWDHWFGNGLKSICRTMTGQTMALFLADHWLNQPVDLDVVGKLSDYMAHRPGVFRVSLIKNESWNEAETVESWRGLDIIEIKPWSIHAGFSGGTTFCPSLWRPELLDRLIEPHWTLWECERLGTERVKLAYPDMRAVGSNPAALTRTHGLIHGKPKMADLTGLNDNDRRIVLENLPDDWRVM